MDELLGELLRRLDIRFSGGKGDDSRGYQDRFLKVAEARNSLAANPQYVLSTAVGLQLLNEAIGTGLSPKLREARLIAEETLGLVVTRNGNLFGKLDMEDMREFIGNELDLTDEALIEAWETIKKSREKED
jgi:hypothetical protein